jgi:hypothetical protein
MNEDDFLYGDDYEDMIGFDLYPEKYEEEIEEEEDTDEPS